MRIRMFQCLFLLLTVACYVIGPYHAALYMIVDVIALLPRPEEKNKLLEKNVNDLIEESCLAHGRGDLQLVSSQRYGPRYSLQMPHA